PGPRTKARTPMFVQRALNALSQSKFFAALAERVLIFDVKQTFLYLSDDSIRREARKRVTDQVSEDTRIIVAHSLGTIVAYEALCAHPEWPVRTFVTLGSPLGIRNLIFDRLDPPIHNQLGQWPREPDVLGQH